MIHDFKGWSVVAEHLNHQARESGDWLNDGQRASLCRIAEFLPKNGVILADEVGMGKTRIAVAAIRAVIESGGRVALLVPPGLGFQWQDELHHGRVPKAPGILRSMWGYLAAWEESNPQPWFNQSIVMLSHAFANWRLGNNSESWRWELLPMLYAIWRKKQTRRFPRRFHRPASDPWDSWVENAAHSICDHIQKTRAPAAKHSIGKIYGRTPWRNAFDPGEYSRNASLRPLLENAVGLGLGVFDLIVIDEAHKSRGVESRLQTLLDRIVMESSDARRFAMTATPVELDSSQWEQALRRIGVKDIDGIDDVLEGYAEAVRHVRQCWRSSPQARDQYEEAAGAFENALRPYLLRRDKRQDEAVQKFVKRTGKPHDSYRHEQEILITPKDLPQAWRKAICAAESLSLVATRDDMVAKRLRLTVANGHGVAAILDHIRRDEEADRAQEEYDEGEDAEHNGTLPFLDERSRKRQERGDWWQKVIVSAFPEKEDALFDHPAIRAAVKEIEAYTARGEKVLVFGRFTRSLRTLTDLLNARAMLRSLDEGVLWPQSKLHKDEHEDEWKAVKAAQRQIQFRHMYSRSDVERVLQKQYGQLEDNRRNLASNLFKWIEQGINDLAADQNSGQPGTSGDEGRGWADILAILKSAEESAIDDTRSLLAKAMGELLEGKTAPTPGHCAQVFIELIDALRDRDEGDADGNNKLDETEAGELWPVLVDRLRADYGVLRGSFARLMYGRTPQATRRMLQLAFNREKSFPKVLIAQSLVGREGLNLHKACRVVILLHPEWNPGVVEQQIGRVDRVGSRWSKLLNEVIEGERPAEEFPHIEFRPVIFRGTYDEHNWTVLRDRWDDLRAQLHGTVVPQRLRTEIGGDTDEARALEQLDQTAPSFSPNALSPISQNQVTQQTTISEESFLPL